MSTTPQVFGNRIRPWVGPLHEEVRIGAAGSELIDASRNGWFDDSDDMFYMGFGSGEGGSAQAKATWIHALENESSIHPVGIYLRDEPSGYVLFAPDPARRIMGTTLWVHPAIRRESVGTTALAKVLRGLFRKGVYRVETEVLRCDDRARAFLKRFGMKREAHRIRSLWVDGKVFDTTVYRVLFPDWEAREDDSYWEVS